MTALARSLGSAALLLAVALAASIARADGEDFGRSGAYVGVGASRSLNLVENYLSNETVLDQINVDDNYGVNARVGYRVFSWFAVEAEYEWLDDFDVSLGSFPIGSVGVQSATANMRFILPIWRFQPYLLLGAGGLFLDVHNAFPAVNALDVTSTSFAGRVGLGIDMYVTPHILVNAGAEAILSNAEVRLDTGVGTFSHRGIGGMTFQLGLGYRF